MMLAMHMVRRLNLLVASLLAMCNDSCNDARVATMNSPRCSRLCADTTIYVVVYGNLQKYLT